MYHTPSHANPVALQWSADQMGTLQPTQTIQLLTRLAVVVVACACVLTVGCKSRTAAGPGVTLRDLEPAIPLPQLGPDPVSHGRPQAIHATVQRIDVPLDQPLDNAWNVVDELAFPAITRGMWHANGLRLGLLGEDDVQPFAAGMPEVLELYETQLFTSDHPLPVMHTPRLRSGARIPMELTTPPNAPRRETIRGGNEGKLQLLAQLEVEGDKTFLILTPHHYQPDHLRLGPRDILERELDGRLYHELAIRIELRHDRLLVVGLYWPWPFEEQLVDPVADANGQAQSLPEIDFTWLTQATSNLADDPAAPPAHLRVDPAPRPEVDAPDDEDINEGDDNTPTEPATIRRVRVAPPLPVHFGRSLLTGTRARQPVQTLLLISLPSQPDTPDLPPSRPRPGPPPSVND